MEGGPSAATNGLPGEVTPERLREVAEPHFGERWQTPLARVLGVDPRTIRRFASGETPIPSGVEQRIEMLEELSELVADKAGASASLEFRRTSGGFFPCYYSKGETVIVGGVPRYVTPLQALAKLLRRPRDREQRRFTWNEL